jgi:hypothetical protein
MSSYIFGTDELPDFIRDRIMCYRKADGSVGYELDNGRRVTKLYKGDRVELKGKYIQVIKTFSPEEYYSSSEGEEEGSNLSDI